MDTRIVGKYTRLLDILVLKVTSECNIKEEVKIREEKQKMKSDKIEKSGCINGWKKHEVT